MGGRDAYWMCDRAGCRRCTSSARELGGARRRFLSELFLAELQRTLSHPEKEAPGFVSRSNARAGFGGGEERYEIVRPRHPRGERAESGEILGVALHVLQGLFHRSLPVLGAGSRGHLRT